MPASNTHAGPQAAGFDGLPASFKYFYQAAAGGAPPSSPGRGNSVRLFRTCVMPELEGRTFTQLDVALMLGVSTCFVSDLESRAEDEVPPAIRLALYYIARVGWEEAEGIKDPEPEHIEEVVHKIFLDKKQIGSMLGLSRGGFLHIRRGSAKEIKMFYKLAILELHERFGFDDDDLQALSGMLSAGARYQEDVAAREPAASA